MIKKVLFPVDFSMVSEYAFGNCIPKFFSTGVAEELILLHVIDVLPVDAAILEAEKELKSKLDKIAKEFSEMGIKTRAVIKIGSPAFEIAKFAEEEDVDLIYMPSKGENVFRDVLIGTTASNVARVATKPVLLVKYGWDNARKVVKCYWNARKVFERLFIALDFSECSEVIVNTIKNIEDYVKEGILFHVVDYGKFEELEDLIKKARMKLEEIAKQFKFNTDISVESGSAPDLILSNAIIERATLIVVGKVGRNVLIDLLIGSTADTVIRRSILPVLIVPCKKKKNNKK